MVVKDFTGTPLLGWLMGELEQARRVWVVTDAPRRRWIGCRNDPLRQMHQNQEQCGQQTLVPGDVVTLIPVRAWHDAGVDDAAWWAQPPRVAPHGLVGLDGPSGLAANALDDRAVGRVFEGSKGGRRTIGDHAHSGPRTGGTVGRSVPAYAHALARPCGQVHSPRRAGR